jgi:hypothetical protein
MWVAKKHYRAAVAPSGDCPPDDKVSCSSSRDVGLGHVMTLMIMIMAHPQVSIGDTVALDAGDDSVYFVKIMEMFEDVKVVPVM